MISPFNPNLKSHQNPTPPENLLPFDGIANYYVATVSKFEAQQHFTKLLELIEWKNDEVMIFGKRFITKRKTAWYGGKNFKYTYSNTTKEALPWTPELEILKEIVEKACGSKFNSCLLNLYHDGNEGMAWHSDNEKELGENAVIASMSLGAERKFSFRHKDTKQNVSVILENGSLLVMKGNTQTNWLHSLPKSVKVKTPRINLTFRTIITDS